MARRYSWYEERYGSANGKYIVTLKNFLVLYEGPDRQPTNWRRPTVTFYAPSLGVAQRIAETAIGEKRCQEARLFNPETNRLHRISRGRRLWRPSFQ